MGTETLLGRGSNMITLKIETNAEEVAQTMSVMPEVVTRGTELGIYDVADEILAISNWGCPVRTGHLKRSGNVRYGSMYAIVGYNTPYARPVHDGVPEHDEYVRAHNRVMTMAWGHKIAPRRVRVRPFMRHMPVRVGRPFLANAVKDVVPRVEDMVRNRIQESLDAGM